MLYYLCSRIRSPQLLEVLTRVLTELCLYKQPELEGFACINKAEAWWHDGYNKHKTIISLFFKLLSGKAKL